jgi:MFS transporter, BCD family, chlorophyll transporter
MSSLAHRVVRTWIAFGPRFLPFADVATPDLPLGRLLRLSLFQVSVGMALVLLVGTLNRVMIVELRVPAALVGIMIALPVLFAPFRALIGFRSDNHRSALGWRRVPYIWKGTMLQFGGLAIMPFALLVLAGAGQSSDAPVWIGLSAAALAFLLVGAGVHIVQTVGLALATDLTPQESHPRIVGLMYVMLLLGMFVSALAFGAALANFSHGRLVQVIQAAALTTMILNVVALWKQEPRRPVRGAETPRTDDPSFAQAWQVFRAAPAALRLLIAVGLGTMAFSMADILLEPFGGQILGLTVGSTTRLTAVMAAGGLIGFALASGWIGRGGDPFRVAFAGAAIGVPAFACVLVAAPLAAAVWFVAGNFLIGLAAALFGHGTLTATMRGAPRTQTGLALGSWGAVQATAAGLGVAISGVVRDLVSAASSGQGVATGFGASVSGYNAVYAIEVVLLCATLVALWPLWSARAGGKLDVSPAART